MKPTTTMKLRLLPILALACVASPSLVTAATTVIYNKDVNLGIPDDNPSGLTSTIIVSSSETVTSIQVSLVTEGGWNGDFYAYLVRQGATSALDVKSVLLNRIGTTEEKQDGVNSSGFDVTFADSAAGDVHTTTTAGFGELVTGTYQPDARDVDPAGVTDLSPRTSFLSEFTGQLAGGTWTLLIADLSTDDEAILKSWSMEMTTEVSAVPEPGALVPLAGLCAAGLLVRRRGPGTPTSPSACA